MNDAPEPTELVYAPRSSWAPALLAAGLAGLVAGLFTWWPYALIGGAVAFCALVSFLRHSWRDLVSAAAQPEGRHRPAPALQDAQGFRRGLEADGAWTRCESDIRSHPSATASSPGRRWSRSP